MKYRCSAVLVFGLSFTGTLLAQCAPGVPSAGNPGCIPPSAPNSPYNQGSDGYPPANAPDEPAPVWRETWGAVALDMNGAKAGMSNGESSKQSAASLALDRCASAGGSHCELRVTYHNQCVALSQEKGGGKVTTATGPDKRKVEAQALDLCGGGSTCSVVYSACSDAVRVQ